MYARVLACDFDGTGAIDGRLAPEVSEALRAARGAGLCTLLVTGRVLEDLRIAEVDLRVFDAVVAENGALIYLPATQRTIAIGTPPPERLLVALREQGIPFHAGRAVIGTWDRHAAQVLDLVRRLGVDQQLVFNRAALMLLPGGVTKAVGVEHALAELGRSTHNMIAFGDAENDLPLFAASGTAVAARGAVPSVAAVADEQLSHPNGEGVAGYVRHLLAARCLVPSPTRHRIVLGATGDGQPVTLPASGCNVLVSGDPRSGKSWLGGLVAERLIEAGYRLCLIDPEGDHVALGGRPQVLAFGHALPLPAVEVVADLLGTKSRSLVLNLAGLAHADKVDYVERLVCMLGEMRRATGIPHWTIVDEAHYFFHETASCARGFDEATGSTMFLTYRPSQLAAAVVGAVGAHLIMRTEVEEERYFLHALLAAEGLSDPGATDALAAIEPPLVGMLRRGAAPRWQLFAPETRITPHIHHARKYVDELLPVEKAFHFRLTPLPVVARNVTEFRHAASTIPEASLAHHLNAGDFSRWAAQVLGDETLAAGFRKLEETSRTTHRVSALEVLRHIEERYAP